MPNRIIKESICASDDFNALTWFEQVFFVRLIVSADDFGRYDARPKVLKGRLFPLSSLTEQQVSNALKKLSTAGMVALYEVDGKPYVQLCAWESHQQIRATKSKYPAPPEYRQRELSPDDSKSETMQVSDSACNPLQTSDINCNQVLADDSTCQQVQANVPVFVDVCVDVDDTRETIVDCRNAIFDSREAQAQALTRTHAQTDDALSRRAAAALAAKEESLPIFLAYKAQTGKVPSEAHRNELYAFQHRLSEGLVLEGFQLAMERGGQSWAYTKRILEDWDRKGLRSVQAMQAEQRSKKPPVAYSVQPIQPNPERTLKDLARLDRLWKELGGGKDATAQTSAAPEEDAP